MYQVGDVCYNSPAEAASASASSVVGSVVIRGGDPYVVDVSSVSDVSITYLLTPLGAGSVASVTVPYTAQSCGLLQRGDALVLSWLVVSCWLAVYGVVFLSRLVSRWGDQSDS